MEGDSLVYRLTLCDRGGEEVGINRFRLAVAFWHATAQGLRLRSHPWAPSPVRSF